MSIHAQADFSNAAVPLFEELVPSIRRSACIAAGRMRPEARAEFIAEVVARAYCGYRRLLELGRGDQAYATPLASYAIRQVRAGRQVGTSQNVRDVTSPLCRQVRGLTIDRLDVYDEAEREWLEVRLADTTASPAEIAALRIDFADWLRRLTAKLRRIALFLATGETTLKTASKFHLSPARISQLRRELMESWYAFQGEPCAG